MPERRSGRSSGYGVRQMVMASPLLETKLYVPKPRRGLVARPRLSERLSRVADSRLTLVSAPAGFGKSTLLAEWLAAPSATGRLTAWLSLDPSDNQASSFWSYLIAALRTVAPEVGAGAVALLESPQQPISAVLTTLLNELSAVPDDIVLVLDDYHLVDASEIQDGMTFLIDHLPPRMHLVIATRADPALPLARLRARGELVEVRAADLRFTPDEAAAYLNEVMGLALTVRDVAALEARTEGWIAALQLAALSMQGRDDIAGFIAGFAGDDRYIVDYLVEEVLQRQPERVRSFLLQTSILDRLSGPLCDAVTGEPGGKAVLEALDRANLFVVPLDDRRRWYRYQHLFADVVHTHLVDERPADIPELHRRASLWFEQEGEQVEAIGHALAAGDFPRVADLVELALPVLRRDRQRAVTLAWLEALPDALIKARPVLGTGYVWVLLEAGRLEAAEARLRDAERWLDTPAGARRAEMVVVNEEEFRDLPATIALYRAAIAQGRGDVPETIRQARMVLDLVPEDEHLRRGSAAAFLGLAAWTSGDLEAAYRMFAEGMAHVLKGGHISDAISGAMPLADFRIAQGRLRDAGRTYEQALRLAAEQGEPLPLGTADLYVGLAELSRERDELEQALRDLQRSKDLAERTGFGQNRSRWPVAMARLKEAQGDLDGALDLLAEAERQHVRDYFFPDVRPLAALKARLWVAQGRIAEAAGWAREQGLSAADDLDYVGEFAHITLARVLLAQSRIDRSDRGVHEAMGLLERLLNGAEAGGRTGTAIEILVLQALGHQSQGEIPAALGPLERALTLAEPEGYVRIFVDEGPPMAVLLEAAATRGIAPRYVRQLVTALGRGAGRGEGRSGDGTPTGQGLIEPLSERELDVLRLLATDLDGPEIASQLVLSLHTVRSHTKSIYAKLGVNNRRAAVRRAEELDLLPRRRDGQPRA